MTEFINFLSSPNGAAIAWVFTVIGGLYGLVKKKQATEIKIKFKTLNASNNELQIRNENLTVTNATLEQKIIQVENNDIHDNYQEVTQTGEKNVNQGVVKGDVTIEL